MKSGTGDVLKKATGKNSNPFFQVEETPAPIIANKATIASPELKETMLYDFPTVRGKTYTLVFK
jgi:alpha-L-fucosidase 2